MAAMLKTGLAAIGSAIRSIASTIVSIENIKDKPKEFMMDKVMAMVVDKVDGIANIERDIDKLQTTLRMIQAIVQEAEEKQIDHDFIRNWLRDLVDIGYEVRDVLEDFVAYCSCIRVESSSRLVIFISSQISFLLSYFGGLSSDTSNLPLAILNRLEKDIRSIREKFDEKKEEGKTFATLKSVIGGGSESVPTNNTRPEVGPYLNRQGDNLFLGREEVKEGIMERLLRPSDNRVHVVPIWGMGGIGKTTLAQSIYNDERLKEEDYPRKNRLWHSVGEDKFSAKKVIREIVSDSNTSGIEKLQEKLVKELKGDRFLFVLDDVWEVDGSEWNLLFNPLSSVGKGGFIIITTRKRQVITATNTPVPDTLRPLSYQHSWSIFESCAFISGNSDSRPDLKCVAERIVKKLNGLPLALEVVGCSLLNEDASTWENFLNSKDDNVMSALRWSYNHLRPPHLKYCFAYCALFPKDHVFDEKVLVEMWMVHDLIQKEEQKRPEDVGIQCFKQLLSASLLQFVDGKYVMHDMVHDLALLVSNEEFSSTSSSLSNDQMEKVRHITITEGDYLENLRLYKSKRILTLYTMPSWLWGRSNRTYFNIAVLLDDLKSTSIRVLVLSQEKITEIPDCIGELRHLRYIDVKQTRVKSLPDSLCHLYHLQVLATPPNAILPKDIVNMGNLRHVRANISTCKGVGKLTSLQELSSICVCKDDNIRELGDMQLLRGKLTIKGLGNVEKLEDDIGALMGKQTLMDELELVFVDFAKSIISEEVLDALGCPPNLNYLEIISYTGVKSPSWMVDGKHKFDKLQTLALYDCCKLESLPPLGELKCLKHFSLKSLHGVKRLGDEFYGKFTNSKVFFPSLESLRFDGMSKWEKWDGIIIENSNVTFFPLLTRLELYNCPKLESLPSLGELTSLKYLSLRKVGVKRLGDEFYGNLTNKKVFFPALESLYFFEMEEWKGWDDISIRNNSNVSFFPRLTKLEIKECPKLVLVLPVVKNGASKRKREDKHPIMNAANFMPSLSTLKICDCEGLERLQLDALVSLKELEISDCKSLVQITSGICHATTIERLQNYNCKLLEKMDFERLPSLKYLDVRSCGNLLSIPRLAGIKFLKLHDCESLKSLSIDIRGFNSLEDLNINKCPVLELIIEEGSSSSSSENSAAVPLRISTNNKQIFRKLFHHESVSLQSLDIQELTGFENFGETEANNFCKLVSLKSLFISKCDDLKSLPVVDFHKLSSLEKIYINDCSKLQSLPLDFHKLSSLNSLSINSCPQLLSLPPSLGKLSSLQSLHIESCEQLQSLLPDFQKLSSLNSLRIKSCPQLQSMPPSLGKLSSLTFLNIDSCEQLQSLPTDFHKLSSLETLNIKSYPQLQSLPADFDKLSSLKILRIKVCLKIQSLPPNFHNLSSLEYLHIKSCPQLQSLPSSFGKLSSLEILKIKSCEQLQSLPPNFHKLSSLKKLNIKSCPQLQSLPPSFGNLSSLEELMIKSCPQLQSLPVDFHKLSSLKILSIEDCPKIQSLPPNFHKLSSLEYLGIANKITSTRLEDCPQLQLLTDSINSLVIAYQMPLEERCKLESGHHWHQIKHIPDIYLSAGKHNYIGVSDGTLDEYPVEEEEEEEAEEEEIPRYPYKHIKSCPQLQSLLADFDKLSSLKGLCIEDCQKIQSSHFHKLSSLEYLQIKSCPQLQSLPPNFGKLSSLEILNIKSCPQLQSLPTDFHKLSSLEELYINDCPQLQSLPVDFHKLSSLKSLCIEHCPKIQSLPPDFQKLSFVDYLLHIKSCLQLQSLPPSFGNLSSLEILNIKSCPELQSLPADLYKLSSLKSLYIEDCSKIQSLPPDFHKLSSLEELYIIDCAQLQSLPVDFHKLSSLKSLWIKHCPKIQSLPPDFHKLSSLKSLRIEDCPKIQPLTPDFHKLSSLKCLGIINEITSTRLEDCPQLQSLKDSIKSLVIAYQMPREERCKLESGHYWHQIKHIPEINLTTGQHNYIRFLPGVPVEYSIEEEDEGRRR